MKISVYVPKELEDRLHLHAKEQQTTPALYVQSLVRERFEQETRRFTPTFATLAGSWEDDRTSEEICRELEESRRSVSRSALR